MGFQVRLQSKRSAAIFTVIRLQFEVDKVNVTLEISFIWTTQDSATYGALGGFWKGLIEKNTFGRAPKTTGPGTIGYIIDESRIIVGRRRVSSARDIFSGPRDWDVAGVLSFPHQSWNNQLLLVYLIGTVLLHDTVQDGVYRHANNLANWMVCG